MGVLQDRGLRTQCLGLGSVGNGRPLVGSSHFASKEVLSVQPVPSQESKK
jgi:hypothetical protein